MKPMERNLSFLFSRLTWPSGMVRERACVEIAGLLIDPRWTDIVQGHLFRWMKAQALESIAAIGLLVLLRAKINDENFAIPPAEEILSALQKPSILSWMLIDELVSSHVPPPDWGALNSGTAPEDFKPDPFFKKHSEGFLPPKYTDLAKMIESKTRAHFVRQWAFEWHRILESIGMVPSSESFNFWGRKYSDHYIAVDSELSEVYRSAYLRALAWAVMTRALSDNDARFRAIITCPIDLGLWRLKPASRPSWWPKADRPEGEIDTVAPQIWKKIETLWEKQRTEQDDWTIAEASGRVHEGTTIYDLQIFGLFQLCQGPSAPSFEKLTDWYRWKNYVHYRPYSLLRFEGRVETVSPDTLAQSFGEWSIVPAACRVSPYSTPRWQFWRIYLYDIWLPASFLSHKPLTFRCSDEAVIVRDGDNIIGKWNDWTYNLKEKVFANLPPSRGQCLFVKRKEIETFAEKTNSAFCWVCRLTGYHREHDFQLYKDFADHRCYGSTSIIIPQ